MNYESGLPIITNPIPNSFGKFIRDSCILPFSVLMFEEAPNINLQQSLN